MSYIYIYIYITKQCVIFLCQTHVQLQTSTLHSDVQSYRIANISMLLRLSSSQSLKTRANGSEFVSFMRGTVNIHTQCT